MMSPAFSRFLNLFDATRQIESAVRAAAEFERARDGRDLSHADTDRAATAVAL